MPVLRRASGDVTLSHRVPSMSGGQHVEPIEKANQPQIHADGRRLAIVFQSTFICGSESFSRLLQENAAENSTFPGFTAAPCLDQLGQAAPAQDRQECRPSRGPEGPGKQTGLSALLGCPPVRHVFE
jgi:hypothetical protein